MESKEQEGSWISRNGVCFTREQLKEKLCESMGGNEDIDRCLYGYISLIRKQLKEKEALESEIERLERIKEKLRESMGGNVDIEEYLAEFLKGYISDSNMERNIDDYYNNDSHHR